MLASVRAMFSGIVDYAGMFPPAQLPLEQAIRNYARYRTEPEGWMLGRFVCPAARLQELSPFVDELFREGPPLVISAVGGGGDSLRESCDQFARDLDSLVEFRQHHSVWTIVDTIETRLPSNLVTQEDGENARSILGELNEILDRYMPAPPFAYFELPPKQSSFQKYPLLIVQMIHDTTERNGFKVRCGGSSADAIPTVKDLAFGLGFPREFRVPLKFTAGLHHAIRHWVPDLDAYQHGFLNVFAAGVLAYVHYLGNEELLAILEDGNACDFAFGSDGLQWRNWRASVAEIESTRRQAVTSFGSCSFDEPRDGLRELGLIP